MSNNWYKTSREKREKIAFEIINIVDASEMGDASKSAIRSLIFKMI